MSETYAKNVLANSLRQTNGPSISFGPGSRPEERCGFRLNLGRSLKTQHRLAFGIALVELILGTICLFSCWSIGPDSHPISGHPFPSLDQRGSLPGLAAVAMVPWETVNLQAIRNASLLLFSFVLLGAALAVVANRADPRIYAASDVERLLGLAPMALLPDLSEVTDEVADEQFQRLATGIEHAFSGRGPRNCVFTGTGPGVGVTTVLNRVKKSLESQGRRAVIVDGSEDSRTGSDHCERKQDENAGALEVLRQAVDGRAGLGVTRLADSTLLTDSSTAAQLARNADCTIVVIESGTTTRAQLRATASTLERLKAPAVRFVLNRVRLAKADPEFRRSLKKMHWELRRRGQSKDAPMLNTLRQAIEEGRTSLKLDEIAEDQPAAGSQEVVAVAVSTVLPPFQANEKKKLCLDEPAFSIDLKELQMKPTSLPKPQKHSGEEIAWPPTRITSRFEPAPRSHKPCQAETREPLSLSEFDDRLGKARDVKKPANSAQKETTHPRLPRLSELKGMHFLQKLKVLVTARNNRPQSAEVDELLRAIEPYEAMFDRAEVSQTTWSLRMCSWSRIYWQRSSPTIRFPIQEL